MLYLGYLMHAWFMFVTPLIYLGYRPSLKKQVIFTTLYTLGLILFRQLYNFISVPFGTHTILLIILNIVLLTALVKELDWIKSTIIALIMVITMLINDSLILIPFMKYFNIILSDLESNMILGFWVAGVVSNFLLIVSYITGVLRFQKKQSYNL